MHPLRAEKLGRVGRDVAGGQDIPVIEILGDHQTGLFVIQSRQKIGQSGFGRNVQLGGDAGQTQIRVNEQDALARLRKGIGQVDGGCGLALTAHRAGDTDDPAGLIRHREKQVGTQELIGLGSAEAQTVTQHCFLLFKFFRAQFGGSRIGFRHYATPPFFVWEEP